MDTEHQENKNIRLYLKLEYPATPPGGRYFDTRQILKRKLEREPSSEELANSEYSMELKIQAMRIQAEQLCQEIVNETDTAIHVAVYLGGKGRVIGVPFIRFVRRRVAQYYQEKGMEPHVAEKLATDSLIDLVPDERALNISGEFFHEQRFDLFPKHFLIEDDFLTDFVKNHPNEPFRRLKSAAVDHLSIVYKKAKYKDVHIVLIDDQSASGVTASYGGALLEEVDRLCRAKYGPFHHQTHIQFKWVDLARVWEYTRTDYWHDTFQEQLNFRQLFGLYAGDTNILDQYSDEQLRKLMIMRQGVPAPSVANILLNPFQSFLYLIRGDASLYITRGGYAGVSNKGEILSVQRPKPDHRLYLEEDFGLGKFVVEVDTAKAVEAFNRELDALFAQGFA